MGVTSVVLARPAVVELFTSEGCSSCPPAELLLGELGQRDDVIALAWHVDYWDYLGWPDRYMLREATPRQQQYARAFHLSGPYTPQVVVDGRRDVLGVNRSGIVAAVQAERLEAPLTLQQQNAAINVALGAFATAKGAAILLVATKRQVESKIARGENAGRTLKEFHIVRQVQTLGAFDGVSAHYSVARSALPADADDVAVLVQLAGHGAIVGAAKISLR
jgi:hypothetical protein